MPPVRIADLVEQILARERIYAKALEGDLANMRRVHGEAPVKKALALLGARRPDEPDHWDSHGHARLVARGLARAQQNLQERPEDFRQATEI
jgi:hypothetical protein